jgi:DNA-binding NarL/FixJ family response regulator
MSIQVGPFDSQAGKHAGNEPCALSIWQELVVGRARIHSAYSSEKREYIELVRASGPPLPARSLALVERVILGESPKAIAYDAQTALSSTWNQMQRAIHGLGLRTQLRALPAMLFGLVSAARDLVRPSDLDLRVSSDAEGQPRLVSMARCDEGLEAVLTHSECQVVRCLIEGCCYTQIASARRTSVRTIANQIASAYRKLGVSGRTELLRQLIQRAGSR